MRWFYSIFPKILSSKQSFKFSQGLRGASWIIFLMHTPLTFMTYLHWVLHLLPFNKLKVDINKYTVNFLSCLYLRHSDWNLPVTRIDLSSCLPSFIIPGVSGIASTEARGGGGDNILQYCQGYFIRSIVGRMLLLTEKNGRKLRKCRENLAKIRKSTDQIKGFFHLAPSDR